MRIPRISFAVSGVAVSLLLAACGDSSQPVSAKAPGGSTATSQPAVTLAPADPDQGLSQPIQSSSAVGVRLSSPPSDATAIPETDAHKAAEGIVGSDVLATMSPRLAVLNDPNLPAAQTDASKNVLVWAYIGYSPCNSKSSLGGLGPGGTPVTATYEPGLTCIGVITVDAHNGRYLMGYSEAANAASIHPVGVSP